MMQTKKDYTELDAAILAQIQERTQWMVQAALLMQCINAPGVNHAELREVCKEHMLAMPELL